MDTAKTMRSTSVVWMRIMIAMCSRYRAGIMIQHMVRSSSHICGLNIALTAFTDQRDMRRLGKKQELKV